MIDFFNATQKDIGLSKEHLSILNCFLDPTSMIKEEAPNPLYLNDEGQELTEERNSEFQPPPSNVPKGDPIWKLFNPDEGTSVCIN